MPPVALVPLLVLGWASRSGRGGVFDGVVPDLHNTWLGVVAVPTVEVGKSFVAPTL